MELPLDILEKLDTTLRPRAVALAILERFWYPKSKPLDAILHSVLSTAPLSPRDRRFVTELVYGTVRWDRTLRFLLRQFYTPAPVPRQKTLEHLLMLGAYQLLFLDTVPPYAAIDSAVELSKQILRKSALARLVNAILRNLHRRYPPASLLSTLSAAPLDIRYSFPKWMVELLQQQYGEAAATLLNALNERPWFGIRRNALRVSSQQFEHWLAEQTPFRIWSYDPRCYQVPSVFPLQQTAAYQQGWFSIQDPAAAMVIHLAQPERGIRILDCCAAPGGKTAFLAEWTEEQAEISALDISSQRVQQLRQNLSRSGLSRINIYQQDVTQHRPRAHYDLVLADVPCSDLGTIRKHPDIKWRKTPKMLAQLQKQQRQILAAAAALVKPGGILLYSTCTVNREENEGIIAWFLHHFPNFSLEPAEDILPEELCSNGFLRILPSQFPTDAAFAARLRKRT